MQKDNGVLVRYGAIWERRGKRFQMGREFKIELSAADGTVTSVGGEGKGWIAWFVLACCSL